MPITSWRFYVYTSGEGEGVGAAVIAAAKKQLGVPYVWEGLRLLWGSIAPDLRSGATARRELRSRALPIRRWRQR